jgi:hypothetical protein
VSTHDLASPIIDTDKSPATTAIRKVSLRLIPFLMLLYICNLLDRNNVGFTKLAVQRDVGMKRRGV